MSDVRNAADTGRTGVHTESNAHAHQNRPSDPDRFRDWQDRSRVVLVPMAAPSIMGLAGFVIATVMVGAWQAGWYGSAVTPAVLWPLAIASGGLLQAVAAVAALRARDGLAVAVHTAWGSFWLGWGVLQILVSLGVVAPILSGTAQPAFAMWFVGLTLVTGSCALAALAQNAGLFLTLAALTGGAGITAAGFFSASTFTVELGGWFFVASAGLAWLVMTAMVLEHSFGRVVIPLGAPAKSANVPGRQAMRPIEYDAGMPGVRVGQ